MSARARTATQLKQDQREREQRSEYLAACRVGLDVVDRGGLDMTEAVDPGRRQRVLWSSPSATSPLVIAVGRPGAADMLRRLADRVEAEWPPAVH